MHKNLIAATVILALAALAAACGGDAANSNNANSNANANANRAASTTPDGVRTGPDGSEIRTETAGGVTTETRTFSDPDGRVRKVVVTNRNGKRTARVYYRDKTVRELPDGQVEQALDATADTLATIGEKGVDVTKDVANEVGDKAEDVGDKAADAGREIGDKAEDVGGAAVKGAKVAGREAADKAEDVGDATAKGAKKAGKATAKGAKKVGGAIKDAVTP